VEGAISGEFTIPSGVSNLSLVLSISGNASQSVKIPVSVTTECKEDNNKGHGNDADGVDEDNTGNSTGVNSNAMDNRKSNDKKKDTCVAGTKYISRIGNITLPIQASQLAFLQENSNLMAYLNGTDGNHTFAVILIILFVGLGLFLRRKFLAV
jgi:hypothetical protein